MSDNPTPAKVQMQLEVVVIPVADVDRSKRFYSELGWRLDADFAADDTYRIVQVTPPGSSCSIHFGVGLTSAPPGSARLYLIVSDVVVARDDLVGRKVDVSEVVHRVGPGKANLSGPHPQRASYASFASFNDPDGNAWVLQEVTARIPGRVDTDVTTFTSAAELEAALMRVAMAHGEHERRDGKPDRNWPHWYAEYLFRESTGKTLPT